MHRILTLICIVQACSGTPLQFDGRIQGGAAVDIRDHPWMLQMEDFAFFSCGATIISATWVLTSASCSQSAVGHYSFRAGTSTRGSGGSLHNAVEMFVHPSYNAADNDYDLALFRVSTPFTFGLDVQAIQLPAQNQDTAADVTATITGWGTQLTGGSYALQLQAAQLPVTTVDYCQMAYGVSSVTSRMICAGYPIGGVGFCEADTGGPLIVDAQLIGVASFTQSCASPTVPNVFAKVASMRDWITQVTGL